MKKIFTILCAALIGFSTASAEVLFSCNFNDSTTGRLSVGAWSSGAIANDNKWYTNGAPSTFRQVVEQQLTYSGYCSSITGKAVDSKRNQQKDYILFPQAKQHTSLSAGEKYYYSFLYKLTGLNTSDNAKNGVNTYISGLLTANNQTGIAYTQGSVFVKTKDASTFQLGVRKKNENAVFGKTELSINTTYLIVVEYIVVSGEKNDVVNLYINPTKESQTAEVSTSDGTEAATYADAIGFVGVGILGIANAPESAIVDEVKVTTSWADLWEAGDEPQEETPTIIADNSLAFGNVYIGEATDKKITVKGSDLKGAISVASSNNQVEVSAASISKEDAEAADGAEITVTLTAAAAGEGSATITLSSQDAANKVINVTWNGVQPIPSVTNIAALKTVESWSEYSLNSEPIVVGFIEDSIVIQDASGAIVLTNLMDRSERYASLKIGDKLSDIQVILIDEENYVHAFTTATLINEINIKSFDNDIEPLEVTTATIAQYGPAYIKLEQVEFTDLSKNSFTAGWFNISQNSVAARIQVPDGCDIIGEAVPAKADVKGLLIYANGGIAIAASADITNRVARSTTAVDNARLNDKARKFVRDGQLYIIRDGKTFNVLGTQISE